MRFRRTTVLAVCALAAAALVVVAPAGSAARPEPGAWSSAVRVESLPGTDPSFNSPVLDGCPFESPDGKSFFMASTRAGGLGGIDIWMATRASVDDPWGAPVNVGAPINSEHNDFCPTMSRDGHTFFFVSNRPGHCGGDDVFVVRRLADGWGDAVNLGCDTHGGPNSAANEAGPFPSNEAGSGPALYFSSTRSGGGDIYRADSHGGSYGQAVPVTELNTGSVEGQPNLRRDGMEIYFFSNRQGNNDIYVATRDHPTATWSTPVNLGSAVNSAASETRPSLSWDGTTLYFGSDRAGGEGGADTYVTYRCMQPSC